MSRIAILVLVAICCGCKPGLVFRSSQEMSIDQMRTEATHIFVGVIQQHYVESGPLIHLQIPGNPYTRGQYWRLLRRDIRIEMVLLGEERRKVVPVVEIFWFGGTSGDWNATQDGERDLFMLRKEGGRYHVVGDWRRSIYRIRSGPHSHLPLDESHPFWERYALMNWRVSDTLSARRVFYAESFRSDPGKSLDRWRLTKILRGLTRYPSTHIRVPACRELLLHFAGPQDECWDSLSKEERGRLPDGGYMSMNDTEILRARRSFLMRPAEDWWQTYSDLEDRRLLTTVNNRKARATFCTLFQREYPRDTDTGCPATAPPPATIVIEQGDMPLVGAWAQAP